MANVGFATLTVIPSMSGFSSRLSAGVSAPLAKTGADAGKQSAGRFKSSFLSGLKGIAAPMAGLFAGAAAIDFLKDAVQGASDLAESGNKVSVIFGPAAEDIMRFAESASTALGQTELEARNAASTFGTYGKAAGLAGDDLSGFSTRLTTLASDMASFYNTSPEEAIEAIGAALRGESEPIRSYGVLLDDATLRQEALKQGLVETTKEALTPQQKVLAAYGQILKQTKDAQGDFARTSGGLANQQRILTAQWSELKAEVGARLLPVLTDLTQWANNEGLPMLKDFGGEVVDTAQSISGFARSAKGAFNDLPGPIREASKAIGGLTAVLAGGAFFGSRITSRIGGATGLLNALTGAASGAARALRFAGAAGAIYAVTEGLDLALDKAEELLGLDPVSGGSALAKDLELLAISGKRSGQVLKLSGDDVGSLTDSLTRADNMGQRFIDTMTGWAPGNTATERLAENAAKLDAAWAGLIDSGKVDIARQSFEAMTGAARRQGVSLEELQRWFPEYHRSLELVAARQDQAARATGGAASEQRTFADIVADARAEIDEQTGSMYKWIEAYNKGTLATIQSRRDQLALTETTKAAWQEVRKGTKTLDDNTKAGRANWNTLLDLAEQWSASESSVINAKGAYGRMRREFIDVAKAMGASSDKANNLANRFLALPDKVNIPFDIPGLDKQQEKLERLRRQLRELMRDWRMKVTVDSGVYGRGQTTRGIQRFASGGLVGGAGTGTSDSNLALLSRGEFVQPKAAVDKYGISLMRAIQQGKFQGGGGGGGVTIQIGQVVAHDYADFTQQAQRRVRRSNAGGVNF